MRGTGSLPFLTVVVSVCEGLGALKRVLADLCNQENAPCFDVVVVDGIGTVNPADLTLDDHATQFTNLRLLRAPGRDVAELRSIGAREAKGQFAAFTEDHCRLPPNWCQLISRIAERGFKAFGGVIEIGTRRSASDWAAYLVEFGAFTPGRQSGPTAGLPGMNCVYERSLLELTETNVLCEPLIAARLVETGVSMHLEPALRVVFERHFTTGAFLRHCASSGQTFASLRLRGATLRYRTAYCLAAVLVLPPVLTFRVVRRQRTVGSGRAPLIAVPIIALYQVAWGLGEAIGSLTAFLAPKGPARSETS